MSTVNIELDGQSLQVPVNSTIMDAANQAGVYIPHFCYHRKLSIAANCRMCLVEVEKSNKPLPACASPVTEGMKIRTRSPLATEAQKGVMEFLLINHPLDCPICDQGGECQLQDLAVGYGSSASRYQEEKRVVLNKNLGPLISTDMTRCIHCTRCVRFGQEIAGVMELGMVNRGEHSEIMPFVERTIDSELSGNMIDVCPVGALTSKPFRYAARTWELSKRQSVAPHDALGSNVVVQVKQDTVLRVTPLDNEAVNECWLSDRDRFSYEALNSEDRMRQPLLRSGAGDVPIAWEDALQRTAAALRKAGADSGWLAGPATTCEEGFLFAALARGLGSDHIDHRLRRSDFGADTAGIPWLGMPVAAVNDLRALLVVGSHLRKDHPLIAHRVRQAVDAGAQLHLLDAYAEDPLCRLAGRQTLAPTAWLTALEAVRDAVLALKAGKKPKKGESAAVAQSLCQCQPAALWLGNEASAHPDASAIHRVAHEICEASGATLGFTVDAPNGIGLSAVGARPLQGGRDAANMLAQTPSVLVLLNVEPELDCADGAAARAAIERADFVVALATHRDAAPEGADLILPIAAWTETAGSRVNCEGRLQTSVGVVPPPGEARPAWKILRVLGNLLGLPGFDAESIEDVARAAELTPERIERLLDNRPRADADSERGAPPMAVSGLQRAGHVPPYQVDLLVRRAPSLQKTADAAPAALELHPDTGAKLGFADGQRVRVRQVGVAELPVRLDARVAQGVARIGVHPLTAGLGPLFGAVQVEPA